VGGRLVILLAALVILPLTGISVRIVDVPERHELVAGAFMAVAYALIVSALAAVLLP